MIPSLLQIPSAVSDSKLHSVLPNNGKGDFQFDRSTGATRINKDGLIEEVGYFSSELVQNGNFSELGSELVTNGDFATDSNWTLATGWSINNGKAHNVGVDGYLRQDMTLVNGKTYKVVFTVSNYVSGSVRVRFMGGTAVSGGFKSSNNTFTQYLTSTGNTNVRLQSDDFIGSIDNVSVKQVDPNDRWTLQNGWSIEDGVAIFNGTVSAYRKLYQENFLTIGKQYKLTFEIKSISSGSIANFGYSGSFNSTGVKTQHFTAIYDDLYLEPTTDANLTIDNVSVVEVQGDRPRLSYDITNGVVQDKPHLLLEPSSTNLVTFSEDFSQWSSLGSPSPTITTNFAISPDGTQNASRYVVNSSSASTRLELGAITVSAASHTFSLYIKNNTGNNSVKLNVYDGSDNNQTFTATDTWQRISYTLTTSATSSCFLSIRTSGDADFLIYGAQFEQLSYSTSLIPTAGTVISRSSETCNNSKPSVNSTEGVLYCEIAALANDLSERQLSIDDETGNNRIIIRYNAVSNNINTYLFASSVQGGEFNYVSSDITQFSKIAFKWKANDFALWVDGSERATDTSGNTFSAGTLKDVSFDFNGNFDFYGKVKGLAVYNEALSESQLMQLTGVTASSIYNNFVTRTASFTVEALNEVKKVIDNL